MSLRRLADHASMTTRSFRANFSRLTAYTPENYKRMLRLQEARRLISLGVPAEVAARSSGYTNRCEFGADYATAFEAIPCIEAVRLRTTSAVDLEE
ncbi:helix-turn-helix domain-containing protein [Ensifer adhaerens]|uniref:helix-turn-helix domain-containing protein n=1 Tax=Ensifer adhaerens TaxID=106592 RepID=UPI0039C335F6